MFACYMIVSFLLFQSITDSLFEKVLFVPKEVKMRVIGGDDMLDNYDLERLCVDSTKDGYCVGPFWIIDSSEAKVVFIDSSGRIEKEYILESELNLKHDLQFKFLDSTIYEASDEPKAYMLKDGEMKSVDNPWYPDSIKKHFPTFDMEYYIGEHNTQIPLFRITNKYIYALNNRGRKVLIYSRENSKLVKEIKMAIPDKYTTIFPDSISQLDVTYLTAGSPAYQCDPLLNVSERRILFWLSPDCYDIANEEFIDIDIRKGIFDPKLIGDLLYFGDLMGATYYVRDETVFYIFSTKKGIYVFKYKP